jgi:hypothetical protein
MSEYQYYEFQSLDRPLTEKEQQELRALSTRAEITAHSFTNEYHWGDFKGDPRKLMEKYFDAFFYVANWGTRQLMLRLPRSLVDLDAIRPYVVGDCFDLHLHKETVVLEWRSDEEGPDYDEEWDNGEGGLDKLLPLRDELLAGDLRPLYLGFLSSVEQAGGSYAEEIDPDTPEPSPPSGLRKLTRAQKRLVDFLRISPELLEAAVQAASEDEAPAGPTADEMSAWLATLPAEDKDAVLTRMLRGELADAGRELQGRFRQAWRDSRRTAPVAEAGRRTVGQLLESREEMADVVQRRAEAERERQRQRKEREKAEAQEQRLDRLRGREEETLRHVEGLLDPIQRSRYDEIATTLGDLNVLAQREGRAEAFLARLRTFRQRHATKKALLERLDRAGVPR